MVCRYQAQVPASRRLVKIDSFVGEPIGKPRRRRGAVHVEGSLALAVVMKKIPPKDFPLLNRVVEEHVNVPPCLTALPFITMSGYCLESYEKYPLIGGGPTDGRLKSLRYPDGKRFKPVNEV